MPRISNRTDDAMLLRAALEGLELQRQRIEEQIQQVRSRLGVRRGRPARKRGGKRILSEAARKRIAAAQKKRWADFRKQQAAGQ